MEIEDMSETGKEEGEIRQWWFVFAVKIFN